MSETWKSAHRLIKNYPRVFKLIWETNPRFFVQAVFLTLCNAVVLPVQIWITKLIIDRIDEVVQGQPLRYPLIGMPFSRQ